MSEPLLRQNNCYNSFKRPFSQEADSYKQYDNNTGDILNCYYPQKSPMALALTTSLNIESFEDYKNEAKGNCDLSKIPQNTHPELYDFFQKEYNIYQTLYKNNSISAQINQKVPIYNDEKTVSCIDGSIPYILEYKLDDDFTRFARFCSELSYLPKISFTTIGDHNIYDYLEESTKQPCKHSTCTTNYAAFLCHNLNSEPVTGSNKEQNQRMNVWIIVGVCLGAVFIIIVAFLLLNLHKKDKEKKYNR